MIPHLCPKCRPFLLNWLQYSGLWTVSVCTYSRVHRTWTNTTNVHVPLPSPHSKTLYQHSTCLQNATIFAVCMNILLWYFRLNYSINRLGNIQYWIMNVCIFVSVTAASSALDKVGNTFLQVNYILNKIFPYDVICSKLSAVFRTYLVFSLFTWHLPFSASYICFVCWLYK